MHHKQHIPQGRNTKLWQMAQRRAGFRVHATAYLILSVFFWLLWALTGGPHFNNGLPWPIWPMLGWGIGLLFHYITAYGSGENTLAEREYRKLINKNNS